MAMKFIVDTIDAIPEAQRGLYTKTEDGKFRLDLDGYEDPAGLKSALDKERKAARDAVAMAKAWKELGKTPEEIQDMLEQRRVDEEAKATKAGEWDKLKQQMIEQQTKERQTLEGRLKAREVAVEKYLVDAQATAAIAAAKGVPALLLPHVKSSVKVIEEDGDFKVRVVDATGNPRVDAKGEFLSIADLVSEMRSSDVFGRAFEADGTTGSGAPQSGHQKSTTGKGNFGGSKAEREAAIRDKYPGLQ